MSGSSLYVSMDAPRWEPECLLCELFWGCWTLRQATPSVYFTYTGGFSVNFIFILVFHCWLCFLVCGGLSLGRPETESRLGTYIAEVLTKRPPGKSLL